MHRNFFLFEKQIKNLAPNIEKNRILEIFTYRKNEVIIHLEDPAGYLHISVDVQFPYLLFGKVFKIRKPKFQFFDMLSKQTIRKLNILPFDKHIQLHCADYRLDMLFFGRTPNLVLYDDDNTEIESFKDLLEQPISNASQKLDFRQVKHNELILIKEKSSAKIVFDFLKDEFYALNKILIREILFRGGFEQDKLLAELHSKDMENLTQIFKNLKSEIQQNNAYLSQQSPNAANRLSIIPFTHLQSEPEAQTESVPDLNRAWWKYISLNRDQEQRNRLNKVCQTALDKRTRFLENAVNKIIQAENIQQRKLEAELKGNLLLTFKNEVEPGSSKAILSNIFSDELDEIEIKLNPAKSVVENANDYFNKYKNVAEKKEIVRIKKDTLNNELQQMQELNIQLESAKYPQLLKLEKELIARKMLPKQDLESRNKNGSEYAFKHYILDREWQVYVGKNGPNNALLTFEFAHKWDIWLHAQGVPGSHVLIRVPGRDRQIPKHVIEQAAQLAAANSKARFSATVPVIYTEVRFVNRVRNALPGTVITRNEQVIFVKPLVMN